LVYRIKGRGRAEAEPEGAGQGKGGPKEEGTTKYIALAELGYVVAMTVGEAGRPRRRERERRGVGGKREKEEEGLFSHEEGFIKVNVWGIERVRLWERALLRNDARP
jgi:hypothetical protein